MGRRLLLILGMLLLASSASPARGQDPNPNAPPADPLPVAPPAAPAAFPDDLVPAKDPAGADTERTPPKIAQPKEKSKKKASPSKSGAKLGAGEWKLELAKPPQELAKPPIDENVVRTQGAAPPEGQPAPGSGAAPAQGGTSSGAALSSAERLPMGKQSVAVTVDVQGPASMNVNQDATLKLIVRNTGIADALNVRVDDELSDGLQFISSQPEMTVTGGQHLSFIILTLPAGSDRVITIKVKPTKTGPFDHAATVRFETGCKSRTIVLEPKLKVDIIANPTVGKVLKGQQVEFKVSVQNTGDGPARNVSIQAKLSPGLKHESGPRGEEQMLYELTLPELGPGVTEKLDPLVADAVLGGEQHCTVVARSPDVVFNKDDAENTKTIAVVEPQLKLALEGPDSRYTDTVADYKITLNNPGTAPARKVRVLATLPISGRLVKVPPEARYDNTTRRLYWTINQLEPGAKAIEFPFQVRMGGIGSYDVIAEVIGEGALKDKGRKNTDVIGMPDVDLVVSERKRVLDLQGETVFEIRLRNYGTKDATHLQVTANLSKNLQFVKAGGGSPDVKVYTKENENAVTFAQIDSLRPAKEIVLGIQVRVVGEDPKLATCRVFVTHDDLPDRFEDMAGVKVTSSRRAALAPGGNP
jgi:uncharacterized repeat protein (TIGR01451 family)